MYLTNFTIELAINPAERVFIWIFDHRGFEFRSDDINFVKTSKNKLGTYYYPAIQSMYVTRGYKFRFFFRRSGLKKKVEYVNKIKKLDNKAPD